MATISKKTRPTRDDKNNPPPGNAPSTASATDRNPTDRASFPAANRTALPASSNRATASAVSPAPAASRESRSRPILAASLALGALLLLVALLDYQSDQRFFFADGLLAPLAAQNHLNASNAVGGLGATIAILLFSFAGLGAFFIPACLLISASCCLFHRAHTLFPWRLSLMAAAFLALVTLLAQCGPGDGGPDSLLVVLGFRDFVYKGVGGALGNVLYRDVFGAIFGNVGTLVLASLAYAFCLFGFFVEHPVHRLGLRIYHFGQLLKKFFTARQQPANAAYRATGNNAQRQPANTAVNAANTANTAANAARPNAEDALPTAFAANSVDNFPPPAALAADAAHEHAAADFSFLTDPVEPPPTAGFDDFQDSDDDDASAADADYDADNANAANADATGNSSRATPPNPTSANSANAPSSPATANTNSAGNIHFDAFSIPDAKPEDALITGEVVRAAINAATPFAHPSFAPAAAAQETEPTPETELSANTDAAAAAAANSGEADDNGATNDVDGDPRSQLRVGDSALPANSAFPPNSALPANSAAAANNSAPAAPSSSRASATAPVLTATGPATARAAALPVTPTVGLHIIGEEVVERSPTAAAPKKRGDYQFPPVGLLEEPPPADDQPREDYEERAMRLVTTLAEFKIKVEMGEIQSGPVITRYEIIPAPGVRVEKIAALANNLAMNLKAESVRVLAPVPGKGTVGIEVPNQKAKAVSLREIIESRAWEKNKHEIPVVLGKDVTGKPIIENLAKMPHCLIAGSTGSGKSVCINGIVASLVYHAGPDDLRFIMVDPKVVELQIYNKLPHMLIPVVTEPKKVPAALKYLISEMERRYKIFARSAVKNIAGFNAKISRNRVEAELARQMDLELSPEERAATANLGVPRDDDELDIPDAKLPYIICFIDELADLMMVAPADIETGIARLAQLARAAGIHLILATQRPSVNVITGIIKANLPTRIAFKVTSVVDSRTILDQKGAETLIGRGDMLFIPPGGSHLVRAQGAYVSEEEIERLVEHIALCNGEPDFDDEVQEMIDRMAAEDNDEDDDMEPTDGTDDPDEDPMLTKAWNIIYATKKASTSFLQRKLSIGYGRAAKIIDALEAKGYIGPDLGPGNPREILRDK